MKKYFMEFLGTLFFVLGIIGAIASSSVLTPLYIGLTLAVVVYMCGPVSGGHVNPAVTIGLLANKKIAPQEAVKYIVAQSV
jgi:aquaporin Z